jgi:hypothetical protein
MAETKITTADILGMIEEVATGTANEAVILEYCAKQKTALANKAAKAKERAEEKRAAGSELRDAVQAILEGATEPLTRDMILAAFAAEDVEANELTVAKVGHQASELVRYGLAHKVDVKCEKGTKVGYVIGAADAE